MTEDGVCHLEIKDDVNNCRILKSEKDKEQLELEDEDLKKVLQEELSENSVEHETTQLAQLSFKQKLLQTDQNQILMEKGRERVLLMRHIHEIKEESEAAKMKVIKAKEDVLSNFMELMDIKLQCSICREYLIKATVLNCSHVFCKLCIEQWMRIKKMCPNCCTPIVTHIQVPALDNCIDRVIEELDDEMKNQRANLLKQRNIEQDKFDGSNSGFWGALKAFFRAEDRGVEIVAAFRRATAQTAAVTHTGAERIRRAVGITLAEAFTEYREIGRSAILRRAAVLAKTSAVRGARLLTKAKEFTETELFSRSAVLRRAKALIKAAANTGTDVLCKSTILRKAAAVAKAAALTGAKALRRSEILKKATALVKAAIFNRSDVLSRSEVTRKAVALTKAVRCTKAEVLPRTPAVRKGVELSRATFLQTKALQRANAVTKTLQRMKAAAFRKAADVTKTAALLRSSAVTRVESLKKALSSFRKIEFTLKQAAAYTPRKAQMVTWRQEVETEAKFTPADIKRPCADGCHILFELVLHNQKMMPMLNN